MAIFRRRGWVYHANSSNHGDTRFVQLGLFTGGTVLNFASPAGAQNDVNPGGIWPSATIGRIEVDTSAGPANWTGLLASAIDGHGILLSVTGVNNLTLNDLNIGSAAGNRFRYVGDLILPQDATAMLVYYLALGLWVIK